MPKSGNPPATRSGDLRDEPVDVEPVKESTDLRTLPRRILAEAHGAPREFGPQVTIGEPVHGMLPAHERDEELVVWPPEVSPRRSPWAEARNSPGRPSCPGAPPGALPPEYAEDGDFAAVLEHRSRIVTASSPPGSSARSASRGRSRPAARPTSTDRCWPDEGLGGRRLARPRPRARAPAADAARAGRRARRRRERAGVGSGRR
jgi:hypothetical protein